jgi:hypothetical protein
MREMQNVANRDAGHSPHHEARDNSVDYRKQHTAYLGIVDSSGYCRRGVNALDMSKQHRLLNLGTDPGKVGCRRSGMSDNTTKV